MVPTSHYQQGRSWQSTSRDSESERSLSQLPQASGSDGPYKIRDDRGAGEPDCTLKLVILGDSCVGKSCLLRRFAEGVYNDSIQPTIVVDFLHRRINLDGRAVDFQLWDTAGQEKFRSNMVSYYRGAQGVLLVYDVTQQKSFDNLDGWLADIDKHADRTCKRVLVGNKCDKVSERAIDFSQAQAWGAAKEIEVFETSAKEGINVDETFVMLARNIISEGGGQSSQHRAGSVRLASFASPGSKLPGEESKSSCC